MRSETDFCCLHRTQHLARRIARALRGGASRPPMTALQGGLHPKGDGGLSAGVAGWRPRQPVHFRGSREQGAPPGARCPSTGRFVGER